MLTVSCLLAEARAELFRLPPLLISVLDPLPSSLLVSANPAAKPPPISNCKKDHSFICYWERNIQSTLMKRENACTSPWATTPSWWQSSWQSARTPELPSGHSPQMLDNQQNMIMDFLCLIWGTDWGAQMTYESWVTPNRSVKSHTYVHYTRSNIREYHWRLSGR